MFNVFVVRNTFSQSDDRPMVYNQLVATFPEKPDEIQLDNIRRKYYTNSDDTLEIEEV